MPRPPTARAAIPLADRSEGHSVDDNGSADDRPGAALLRGDRFLEVVTLGWNAAGIVVLAKAARPGARTVALIGFRLDSLIRDASQLRARQLPRGFSESAAFTPLLCGFATANTDITLPAYTFSGFDRPVTNQPAVNKANAGRAIPLKFGLGGDQGLDVLNTGQSNPTVQPFDCATGSLTGRPTQIDTAGGSGLQYDPGSGRYTYVWKTSKTLTGCQRLALRLDDGTSQQLDFQFS